MTLPHYLGKDQTSDTACFQVKQPQGLEEDALRLFRRAQQLSWTKEKSDQAFAAYEKLVKMYPTSDYVPGALYQAALCYKYAHSKTKRQKSIEMYKRLIKDYPDFISLDRYFGSICLIYENMKDKEGAVKTLRELIRKHPDTKISEGAQRRLKQVDDWEF